MSEGTHAEPTIGRVELIYEDVKVLLSKPNRSEISITEPWIFDELLQKERDDARFFVNMHLSLLNEEESALAAQWESRREIQSQIIASNKSTTQTSERQLRAASRPAADSKAEVLSNKVVEPDEAIGPKNRVLYPPVHGEAGLVKGEISHLGAFRRY
jgi:hypothetical protein